MKTHLSLLVCLSLLALCLPAPAAADWVRYLGLVVDGGGRTLFLFKDNRTARVVSLSEGGEAGAWELVSRDGGGFVLRVDGRLVRVPAEVSP